MARPQPERAGGSPRTRTARFLALVAAGLVLRAAALPLPGTGDVLIWKTWAYNAANAGEATLYGVGGHPLERRELAYRSVAFTVDYPPLALYELGLAGRMYRALDGEMPDNAAFTVAVKLPPLLADAGMTLLLYLVARRMAGARGARLAALAWWLNPAAIIEAPALGYLDPLCALPAVAAVGAGAAGRTWLAGVLLAAAAMTKAQGAIAAPAVLLASATAHWSSSRPSGPVVLRLGETLVGALAASLVVAAPFALAGSLPNMWAALASLARHDMLSGNAANLWWIATWVIRARVEAAASGVWHAVTIVPRILAISRVVELGYPNPRFAGLVLMGGAWAWALWRTRRARDLALVAGLGAFLVHAYFVLAAQVHENHLFLAIPFAIVAAAGRRRWRGIAAALTAIQALNLNLFYGFSEGVRYALALPRTVTLVDAAVVLSAANCIVLGWHAWTLARESNLLLAMDLTDNPGEAWNQGPGGSE